MGSSGGHGLSTGQSGGRGGGHGLSGLVQSASIIGGFQGAGISGSDTMGGGVGVVTTVGGMSPFPTGGGGTVGGAVITGGSVPTGGGGITGGLPPAPFLPPPLPPPASVSIVGAGLFSHQFGDIQYGSAIKRIGFVLHSSWSICNCANCSGVGPPPPC